MANEEERDDALLTTRQAAAYLNFKPKTLEGWRYRGGGPPYIACTARAVRYRKADLDAWLESRRRRSTADTGRKGRGDEA